MSDMLNIICGALLVGGYITIFSSVITLIIALFDKNKKSAIISPVIALVAGILLVLLSSVILRFV